MIICIGTTPVYQRTMEFDRVAVDSVNRARHVHDYASGKSINVARVIHALGESVLASGFVGGERGHMLCRDLDRASIAHDFVQVWPQTRQCITVIDKEARTATELIEESAPVGQESWAQLDQKLSDLLPRGKVWVFSGTLPPDAPLDFYARWLPLARQFAAAAIVDARGTPLELAMAHANAIVKVNRDELSATLKVDLSSESNLISVLRDRVPSQGALIVTAGPAGAFACKGSQIFRAIPPKVDVISAIGSGDAFAAGLAVGIERGTSFEEQLRLAVACGAANAMTPFAGHVMPEQLRELAPLVQVEEVG